jgi:hypothetical protein
MLLLHWGAFSELACIVGILTCDWMRPLQVRGLLTMSCDSTELPEIHEGDINPGEFLLTIPRLALGVDAAGIGLCTNIDLGD